ncbi:MAG: PilN domain-containing protein [Woeseiaceae bacterium]
MKKQDINLLIGAPRRSSPRPTARQSGITLLALMIFGVVAGLWQENRRASLEQAAATLNADIDGAMMSLEERSLYLAERDADPALVAELKRREREADDKSRVLDLLSGESVGNTDGFSAHLAAFGRRHPEGLWLENIRIEDGGRQLMLAGRTLHASLVPKFLSELQLEPALAGTAFATFTMSEDDSGSGPLRFALATACVQHDGSEATAAEGCAPSEDGAPDASFAATEPSR